MRKTKDRQRVGCYWNFKFGLINVYMVSFTVYMKRAVHSISGNTCQVIFFLLILNPKLHSLDAMAGFFRPWF